MSNTILKWLGGRDVGQSSKAIALTAMGEMPRDPGYPHDTNDLSRCLRLLAMAPEAQRGLDVLAKEGGPVWVALGARWKELEAAYRADEATSWKQNTVRQTDEGNYLSD